MNPRKMSVEELEYALSEEFQKRFWVRVKIGGFDECWPWSGGLNEAGYGRVRIWKNSNVRSHRIAWMIASQSTVPDGLGILHSCKAIRSCCNPCHLRAGTDQDNTNDTISQGRFFHPDKKGEKNGQSKLTNSDIPKIRELYASGNYHLSEIGKLYGVHFSLIWLVVRRKIWKHI